MTTPVAAGAPVFAFALYEGQPYTDTDIVVDLQAHLAALVENPNTRSRLRSRVDPEARWLWTLIESCG
jgi:hypothetical protein